MEKTTDLSELEHLSKKLKNDMGKSDFSVGVVISSLNRKIDGIRASEAQRRIKENIPESIQEIIRGIARGELDVDNTKQTISDRASELVKGRQQTRFTLTEQQERDQIIHQIEYVLSTQGKKFPIVDPEKTIQILQGLLGKEPSNILNTIVSNLLERRLFDEAEGLCDKYGARTGNDAHIYNLRKIVKRAKIGDFVHRIIKSNSITDADALKFFQVLQAELTLANIGMDGVVIGRTADGSRKITLADIWPENSMEKML